jgi:hypothetical protein
MKVDDDVRPLQGGVCSREHAGLEQVGRIEQAREILEHVLRVCFGPKADDREPGGLRLGTYDRQVLTDQGVQEAGLSDVGGAGEGDVAGEGHMRYPLSAIRVTQ